VLRVNQLAIDNLIRDLKQASAETDLAKKWRR
jgi:hypothetical protein